MRLSFSPAAERASGRRYRWTWFRGWRRLPGHLTLWAWAALCLVPVAVMVLSSVKSNTEIYIAPLGLPNEVRVDNYLKAWYGPGVGPAMGTYMLNSVIVAILSLSVGVGSGTIAGYALSRWRGRWSDTVYFWLLVLLTVPLLVAMIPIFHLVGLIGLRNNLFGISLVYAAFIVPTATFLMRSFFDGFPSELLEAARLDGCSEWRAFRSIVFPLSYGAITGVAILSLLWVWGELLFAIVLLTRPDAKTLPVGILALRGQYYTDLGGIFAALTVATGPIIAAFLLFQRRITKGVTFGAFH
jgi:ABC-type glycerol-3-phosphate transport system permease component